MNNDRKMELSRAILSAAYIAAGIIAIYLACRCIDALRRIIFDRLATYLSTHASLSGRSKT